MRDSFADGLPGGTPDVPSFSFYSSDRGDASSSSESSEAPLLTESTTTSEVSQAPESSETTSEMSQTPESTKSTASGTSQPIGTDKPSAAQKCVLSYDPINEKTLEINGKTATIIGKTADVAIDRISVSPKCAECALDASESGFTATIELIEPYEGNMDITLKYKDGYYDEMQLAVTPNGFALPELPEITQSNERVTLQPLEQPPEQVAEYIVKGGDPDEVRGVLGEIKALSDVICEGLGSDYDKLRAISRWVSANIYYDYPAYNKGVPEETLSLKYMLNGHSSVCGGYSNMTSALCAAQGIKCWNVHGSVLTGGYTFSERNDGEYHEWNYAEIDGRVIWVDSGWNSFCTLRSDGTYINGGIYYRYFDIGEEYFALNHKSNYAEYRDYFALA